MTKQEGVTPDKFNVTVVGIVQSAYGDTLVLEIDDHIVYVFDIVEPRALKGQRVKVNGIMSVDFGGPGYGAPCEIDIEINMATVTIIETVE